MKIGDLVTRRSSKLKNKRIGIFLGNSLWNGWARVYFSEEKIPVSVSKDDLEVINEGRRFI